MKRVVFDLDETICVHRNRDYANAEPVELAILRMRELREKCPDCEIVIHTARGMKSCDGDAQKADAKNRAVTEDWLKRNGVPYDRLVFGKPFADAYIDDKAVSLEDWMFWGYQRMSGYSGKPLHAVGRIVVKDDPDGAQRDWYAEARRVGIRAVLLPRVISWSFSRLFLRRVEGVNLSCVGANGVTDAIPTLHTAIREMGGANLVGENDVEKYAALVAERARLAKMDATGAERLRDDLLGLRDQLKRKTFCHGDFTTMNLVRSQEGVYLLDPSVKPYFQNYLLDAAKFRASLRGLEFAIERTQWNYADALDYWDSLWSAEELRAIYVLERTHLVRVAGLAREKGDDATANMLLAMEVAR